VPRVKRGAIRRARAPWLAALALLAACLALAAAWPDEERTPPPAGGVLGLFTSLPIQWREAAEIGDLLSADAPPHPALAVLARHGRVTALDTLADRAGALPLAPGALLVMAQPRPLSPPENVALDRWVRGGGHVLLFADPLLTAHSAFAIGDRRRPQDVALLSPILARWGLALTFDEAQAAGERVAALDGVDVPVNLPGRFALLDGASCELAGQGLLARCRVGKGRVTALADAALFEAADMIDGVAALSQPGRDRALDRLLAAAAR
jgi:hypothetical protein